MFEFATGKTYVLEKRIFDKLDQERMLKAPNFQSAFNVLHDTDLGEIAAGEKEIEKILEKDLMALKKNFSQIFEDEKFLTYLFLKFDASNIKLGLKKYKEKELNVPYIAWAIEPGQKIEKYILALGNQRFNKKDLLPRDLPNLNPYVEKLISLTFQSLEKLDSLEIENTVDQALFKIKRELASKINPFLRDLTKIEIDVLNIKNLIQAGKGNKKYFIEGGNLSWKQALNVSQLKETESPKEKFLEIYKIWRVLKKYREKGSLLELEKDLQNFLSEEVLKKSKESSCGLPTILAFFQKKINAQHNIRLILFSKLNNIDVKEIENKLLII